MQSKPKNEQTRNQSIDLFRLIAAFGVIAIHLSPSTVDGERFSAYFLSFAVPYFLIISLYYFMRRFGTLATPQIWDFRFDRLLVPYVVWSIIYFMIRCLKYRLENKPFDTDYLLLFFYGGASVQLYFLPLLFLFQVFAFALLLVINEPKRIFLMLPPLIGIFFYGYFGSINNYLGFTNFQQNILFYVFAAWILVFLQASKTGRLVNVFTGCLALGLILLHPELGYVGNFQGPLIGFGVASLAINCPFRSNNTLLGFLLSCAYGIFLSHFLFLEAFELIMPKFGLALAPYSWVEKLVLSSLIALVSILFVLSVRRNRRAAYLLLGEI
jgi:peptidoglycan/LPS O-acetylase OafA/YrhL